MSKNMNAKYTASPQEIWKKFEAADKKQQYFEYECYHPEMGLCVRNTVLEYCPIITRAEAFKRETENEDTFFAIVESKTNKEFSPYYWYFMDVSDAEDPEYFAVRKKEVLANGGGQVRS